jgi:ParB family chromosome partitioning protein
LLEKLVSEKLERQVEAVRAEGWKWLEVAADFPYGHTAGLRRIAGETEPLTDEEMATREALRQEMEELEQQYRDDNGEDLPEEIDQRLAEFEAALENFENRPVRYDAADVARAGAFVSIDRDGRLKIERGYVRPEDETQRTEAAGDGGVEEGLKPNSGNRAGGANSGAKASPPSAGAGAADANGEDDGLKPLSERLTMELTAYRTLALRDALAKDPQTAFLAVLHALVLQTFYHFATDSCLEITAKSSGFPVQGPDLKECRPAKAIDERRESWAKRLPEEPQDVWEALNGFDPESRLALFAHCAALAVNAVQEPWNRAPGRKRHSDQLAQALTLDMAAAGWKPTAENYLSRVPKSRILEAVSEAKGASAADLIAHLKKSDMAKEAERLLSDSGWLPELLRTPGFESSQVREPASTEATAAELPAFLGAAE